MSAPILAQIRVTNRCNLSCPYCYANDDTTSIDMSLDKLYELVDICEREGVLGITWTGGEPFCRTGFVDILKRTHQKGIRQTVLTNGTLLSEELTKDLPRDNLNFQISLNSVWEDKKGCDGVIDNVSRMVGEGYEIQLSAILERVEISQYEELIQCLVTGAVKVYAQISLQIS